MRSIYELLDFRLTWRIHLLLQWAIQGKESSTCIPSCVLFFFLTFSAPPTAVISPAVQFLPGVEVSRFRCSVSSGIAACALKWRLSFCVGIILVSADWKIIGIVKALKVPLKEKKKFPHVSYNSKCMPVPAYGSGQWNLGSLRYRNNNLQENEELSKMTYAFSCCDTPTGNKLLRVNP